MNLWFLLIFFIIVLLSCALVIIFAPSFIAYLKKQKMGQAIREDGPQTHLGKAGTPTMGGLLIFSSTILVTVIILITYVYTVKWVNPTEIIATIAILLFTIAVAVIGILDDTKKIKKGRSLGLTSKQKLLLQFIFSALFLVYLYHNNSVMLILELPFMEFIAITGTLWKIAWGIILLIFLMGYTNAVNLTDGLDGLCGGVTVIVSLTLGVIACYQGNIPLAIFLFAIMGSCIGFLRFNLHPAKLFMGDTGSLALGAALAGSAIMLNAEIYFIISSIVYLIEAFSVVLQVTYFKLTKGKRIFRMSPFHHHLEQGGWSETKIVNGAMLLTTVTSAIALVLYFKF